MAWSIDRAKCLGCGVCASVCPNGIEMVEGKAKVVNQDADCLEKAANVCPIRIIKSE